MPLAVQALLPLAVLLLAALVVRMRPRRAENGWVATLGTALAALIALVELIRLSPGEHVDVPFITTFPYAELLVRLDGLTLAFTTVTLATAAMLMLVRQQDRTDRRDPWMGWLLTSAALIAFIMAGNLLLVYVLLQVLTLAWSGALDETAPRRRALRITLQIADIGLLLAAASAIQSVGTSSFSGVPSDTFGIASFGLMLLPVVVRIGAIAWAARRPLAVVAFGPAIAWLAPAAYLLLRLLALMGGQLPDRPTAVALFGVSALAAIILGATAIQAKSTAQVMALLVAAQIGLALALSSGNEPLLTIACTWMWLLLIPLAGLTGVRITAGSLAETLTLVQLAMIPTSVGFVGIWLGSLALIARGLALGVIPLALAVIVCAIAALTRARLSPTVLSLPPINAAAIWAGALLVIAAFPIIVMNTLVIPAAATVRLVPGGTVSASPLGLSSSFGVWPALLVSLIGLLLLAFLGWVLRDRAVPRAIPRTYRAASVLSRLNRFRTRWTAKIPQVNVAALPASSRYFVWGAFALVALIALVRP